MVTFKEKNTVLLVNKYLGRKKILLSWILFLLTFSCFARYPVESLQVSKKNPHLLVASKEKPVFLNSYTVWRLLRNASKDDVEELLSELKKNKINAISMMVLDLDTIDIGMNYYGNSAFALDEEGIPNPSRPIVKPNDSPQPSDACDFWDHLDFVIRTANEKGMYVILHPAWGDWFSGSYDGDPNKYIIFNENNAREYGRWIGNRYRNSKNVIWMLGGDRSAVYGNLDYRNVYAAMAEGITRGVQGAQENIPLISYHPRKWAQNSSDWFHHESWLSFNSIQDIPSDQVSSLPRDFDLKPTKPTWLCEGRYEGAISDWGIRYQAWQTVLSGGFGHTYGSDAWMFPKDNWRQYLELPGLTQMGYLYYGAREIWSDKQFLNRMPDQNLIVGDQGTTIGDRDGHSDRITAMRGNDGTWAMVYTASGKDIHLDTSRLKGRPNAYWFNPATGKWWVDGKETTKMKPFKKRIKMGDGTRVFDAPGDPVNENDWVLILRK